MISWFGALSIGKKVGAGIAFIAALAALTWGINAIVHSLKQAGRDEVQAQWNADKAARAGAKADLQIALGAALQPRFDDLAQRISGIDTKAAEVNLKLPAAIAAAPRYRDPNCSLTPDVLGQINSARALSGLP
jgi:uncharacterized protein YidB (DUF937 family)